MCEPANESFFRVAYYRCHRGSNASSYQILSFSQTLSWYKVKGACQMLMHDQLNLCKAATEK